ncbi:unnamed protein product, partial [Iphiclides podalirius]
MNKYEHDLGVIARHWRNAVAALSSRIASVVKGAPHSKHVDTRLSERGGATNGIAERVPMSVIQWRAAPHPIGRPTPPVGCLALGNAEL